MGAIYRDDDQRCVIDPEACTDCGTCADICPMGAIVGAEAMDSD
jgi:Fe-S-cluster-containing hydrogenase component 2